MATDQELTTITLEIPKDAAWDFAQFLKRVGLSEPEAYRIQEACYQVQKAFADHGFSPR